MKLIQYGSSSLANSENLGVPIIRMNNLQDDELDLTNLKHIQLSEKEISLLRLQKGDILFNRTNSKELVGKCAVFREETEYVYASYLIKVRLDETKLLPDFASLFLGSPTGRLQIDCISRQIIGMTNINTEEIKSLKLPIPPIEFQEKAVEQIKKAYTEKKAKEAEAERLLASVDGLVLDALGITLPDREENTLDKRIFFTKSSEISSGRFDPHYFSPKFFGLRKILQAKNIEFVKLLSSSKKIFSGITPLSGGESYTTKELGIPFVRSGDYSIQNEIDFDDLIYLKPDIHSNLMKGSKLKKGDLLIAIVGATIGKVGVYNYDFEANINQAVCGIRLYEDFNPFFVQAFLLSSVGQMILDRIKRPVARANINLEEIGEMLIPKIELKSQVEIAEQVEAIYAEAKRLREQGKETLKQAKLEVEKMILGE